jgi:integrase
MLSDSRVRTVKSGERPFKLSDGGGLYLLVQPNGGKLWRLAYRYGGKQKSLALGAYPAIALKHAREKRDAAKRLLADQVDPAVQRRLDKLNAASPNTFRALAEELLRKLEREKRAEVTIAKKRWLLSFVFPTIGDRPVNEISAPEVLSVLRKIEARGRYETAQRLRSTCGMVFRYAVASGKAVRDPSADLRGALTTPKVTHRAAIVDPREIGALLRAIDDYAGLPLTKAALRLAPLVFVRPGELRKAEWSEFNLEVAEWRIPAAKMKMGRPHRVPLSRQALAIVQSLKAVSGAGRWLFPSVRTLSRPLSENTLNAALRRLGYSKDQMTAHGFRGLASTRLNECGRWSPDVIERQLAHQEANGARRPYMHTAEFWPDRVAMMQAWADYLDELRIVGNVVELKRAAR